IIDSRLFVAEKQFLERPLHLLPDGLLIAAEFRKHVAVPSGVESALLSVHRPTFRLSVKFRRIPGNPEAAWSGFRSMFHCSTGRSTKSLARTGKKFSIFGQRRRTHPNPAFYFTIDKRDSTNYIYWK